MKDATRKNRRQGLRLALSLIALCLLGYCVEIFIMGAPDFKKRSFRTYYRDKDPIPFWTQFSLFGAAGVVAAYFSINWKRGLPLFEAIDERDRKHLKALGPNYAQKENRQREMAAVVYIAFGITIVGFLASLLILS